MLITDKNELKGFSAPYRLWQGIPGIEVTKKGRIFSTWYSGGVGEQIGNFCVLVKSDDGENFGEPIAVAFLEKHRCYDPCLWIDPKGRLWFIWSVAPDHATYAAICDDPDADELRFAEVRRIGADVMMNKPTVLSTGEWLFPIAVWRSNIPMADNLVSAHEEGERKAFVYKSVDQGKSLVRLGGADIPNRSYDEHMILEREDGSLSLYVRTEYGIGVCHSYDGGKNFTEGEDSRLGGPDSRFFIARLKSGRILLVNNDSRKERTRLMAMLSEDGGRSFPYRLMLDERMHVSYPDAKEAEDGYIYVTYDRERGAHENLRKVYAAAREILYAKITDNDIINGTLTDEKSRLKCVVSKLGRYARENENPFKEQSRLPESELAEKMLRMEREEMLFFLFEHFGVNCVNMHRLETGVLDALIEKMEENTEKIGIAKKIISLLRSVTDFEKEERPIVSRAKAMILENLSQEISVREIAYLLGVSMYYLCHLFKKSTGITIVDYKKEQRIIKAKALLVQTDMKITDIAQACGFGSDSYFCKVFMESESVSPTQYRAYCK